MKSTETVHVTVEVQNLKDEISPIYHAAQLRESETADVWDGGFGSLIAEKIILSLFGTQVIKRSS
eukprot:2046704-Rhodomonas_salina.3